MTLPDALLEQAREAAARDSRSVSLRATGGGGQTTANRPPVRLTTTVPAFRPPAAPGAPLTVAFLNVGCRQVGLVWDSPKGQVPYPDIPPGSVSAASTLSGHHWLFLVDNRQVADYTALTDGAAVTVDSGGCDRRRRG